MRAIKISWPDTPVNKNVMFIGQLIHEMVREDVFESFRVFSLNTMQRLDEALEIISDIEKQRLPMPALEPVIAELQWSLAKDAISKEIAPLHTQNFEAYLRITQSKRDIVMLRARILKIKKVLSSEYRMRAEKGILELLDTNRKKDIYSAVRHYCSYLISIGYTKDYLDEVVEEMFFSKDLTSLGHRSVRSLFRRFDCIDRKFHVFAFIDKSFATYIAKIPGVEIKDGTDVEQHILNAFDIHPGSIKGSKFYYKLINAKDANQASHEVGKYLSSVRAITFLSKRGINFDYSDEIYVTTRIAAEGHFYVETPLQFQTLASPSGHRLRALYKQSKRILTGFDPPSTERLLSSINTSALARSTINSENQLISFWSAVEVLLSDPPPNVPRIAHYVNLLVPLISFKYTRRYIIAIYDELQISYRSRLNRILRDISIAGVSDSYSKFTHLIFDEKFDAQRSDLLEKCDDNPLALFRLKKLYDDFRTPAAMKTSINAYQERLGWQIHRVYRARNHLVHSGHSASYLDSLAMNIYEYYRSAIGSILHKSSRETEHSNIDQIISEVAEDMEIHFLRIKLLKQDERFVTDDIRWAFI